MPRFRFQLDPLLDLRKRTEQQQQVVVASIESERRRLEDQIRSCHETIEQSRSDLRERLGVDGQARIDAREAAWQTHSMLRMRAEADALVIKLAGVMKRLEHEREILVEHARERRSIEKLREHREEAWRSDQMRRERLELDDMVTSRRHDRRFGGER
jgi:flagellar protein FliJ